MTLTVELPDDVSQFVQRMLASGRFHDTGSLAIEALRCYVQEAAFLDSNMTPDDVRVVRQAAAELDHDPTSAVPIEDVMARFRIRREGLEKLSA